MRIRSRSLAPLAILLLTSAACGDSASSSSSTTPDGAAPPASRDGGRDSGAEASGGGRGDDDDASTTPDGTTPDGSTPGEDSSVDAGPPPRQVLVWVWLDYANAINSIAQNAKSFTHVSPALYNINYDYKSGAPHMVNGNDDYNGLSSKDIADKVHAAGLKIVPLMYAGAGNFGTDQGIQNILNDTGGAQQAFIDALIAEGKDKGFDGWNLDWEVSNTGYGEYGTKLVSFLKKAKAALNAQSMQLSLDLGSWYVRQCDGSGGDGLVDLKAVGDNVDWAIQEAYSGALGSPGDSCPSPMPSRQDCDKDFVASMSVMCNMPLGNANIGLISPGSNGFAAQALDAAAKYGFRNVAVWPDDQVFLKSSGMPNGDTWYSILEDFLSQP